MIIKKNTFFFIQYKKRKMQILSTKERKSKFNTNDLTFRKKFNLPSGTPLSAKCNSIECSSTGYKSPESLESLINKNKHFGTKSKQTVNFSNIPIKTFCLIPSNKFMMIEEFKDEIEGLKNI